MVGLGGVARGRHPGGARAAAGRAAGAAWGGALGDRYRTICAALGPCSGNAMASASAIAFARITQPSEL
jgi:hypothetical protein